MCTYATETFDLAGSAKAGAWFPATRASVYVDHPVHHPRGHALLVDVTNPSLGPGARVALELDPASARGLAEAILRALDAAPTGLLDD